MVRVRVPKLVDDYRRHRPDVKIAENIMNAEN